MAEFDRSAEVSGIDFESVARVLFLRKLREKQHVEQATSLVDQAHSLTAALGRLGLRYQVCRHRNRNAVERVFCKTKALLFSDTLSNAAPSTAESWP